MKKVVFCCCLLLYVLSAHSQNKQAPYHAFIPKGYALLDSASGDLNRDAYKDMVLILKNNIEEANRDTTRPLLLLAGMGNGMFQLMERNDNVVLCAGCGGVFGDPYRGITIKNGYFSIEHYGGSNWRWTRIITFKWDTATKRFKLHRDAGVSFHTSDPEKQEMEVYNKAFYGKMFFTNYTNDNWE